MLGAFLDKSDLSTVYLNSSTGRNVLEFIQGQLQSLPSAEHLTFCVSQPPVGPQEEAGSSQPSRGSKSPREGSSLLQEEAKGYEG